VIKGQARIENHGWQGGLKKYETLLIPAASYHYTIIPEPEAHVLRASVPVVVE
jgi:hypothetical protein